MSKELVDMWNEQDGIKKLDEILEVMKSIQAQMRFLVFAEELKQKAKEREQ